MSDPRLLRRDGAGTIRGVHVLEIGPGDFALKYVHFEFYPPYHDYDAEVEGYRAEDLFGLGRFGSPLDLF